MFRPLDFLEAMIESLKHHIIMFSARSAQDLQIYFAYYHLVSVYLTVFLRRIEAEKLERRRCKKEKPMVLFNNNVSCIRVRN